MYSSVSLTVFAAAALGLGIMVAAAPIQWVLATILGIVAVPLTALWAAWVLGAAERWLITVAVVSVILLRLPQIWNNPFVHVGVLLPFWVALVASGGQRRPMSRVTVLSISAFLLILSVQVLRGGLSGAHGSVLGATLSIVTYLTLSAFGWRLFSSAASDRQVRDRLIAVLMAPSAYVAANVVFLFLGVTPPNFSQSSLALNTPAEMLGALGISAERINFPMGLSVNNFGVLCGIGLSSAIVLAVRFGGWLRGFAILGSVVCLYGLLRGDSRVSLLSSLIFAALVVGLPKLRLSGLALIAPVAPVALIAIFASLAQTDLGQSVTDQSRDVATGSGRTEIWLGVWKYLREGNVEDIWGHGAAGQISSGAARYYVHVFHGQRNPERFSVHNAFLQQMLDGGFIGVIGLAAVLFFTLRGLTRLTPGAVGGAASGGVAAILTLLFAGFTEVAPSYYAEETLGFVLLISWGAATTVTRRPAQQQAVGGRVGLASADKYLGQGADSL